MKNYWQTKSNEDFKTAITEFVKKIVERAMMFDLTNDPFALELELKYRCFDLPEDILDLPIEDFEKKIAEIMGEDIDEEDE